MTLQPWALAICMFSIFCIFFVELLAFRWGTSRLAKLGITYGMCFPITFTFILVASVDGMYDV